MLSIQTTVKNISAHVRNNKTVYITGAACLTVGAALGFGYSLGAAKVGSDVKLVQKVVQVAWKADARPVMINLIERSTASKPVHLVGTNLYFNSMSEAAKETGHTLQKLSRHINGHLADIDGDVFELLQPAA